MIRRAALRDHSGTPEILGYTRAKDYQEALARKITDASRSKATSD